MIWNKKILERVFKEYRYASNVLHSGYLATSEKNWTNTERRIDYFYNKFCSAFGLSKQDIYDFISLYKSLSVVDYMKLKQYFTLTDEIISVEV